MFPCFQSNDSLPANQLSGVISEKKPAKLGEIISSKHLSQKRESKFQKILGFRVLVMQNPIFWVFLKKILDFEANHNT